MIRPTIVDILNCIEGSLGREVEPYLENPLAKSALATTKHLLRNVARRIVEEGAYLVDDITALRSLLQQASSLIRDADLVEDIRVLTSARADSQTRYRDLVSLGSEAIELRRVLCRVMEYQQGCGSREDAPLGALGKAIQQYLINEIEAETDLTVPAFAGMGPRR